VKLAVAFLLGMVAMVAIQGKTADWLTSTVRSYHMERKGYEEQNYGLGIETDVSEKLRLALGFYRNSERRDSVYGAFVYCPVSVRWGNWRGCGMAGGVTGYSDAIAPLAGFVLSWEGKEWGVNVLALPNKRGDFSSGLLAAQIKRRF
jgi:hypothetical protein